MNTCQNCGKIAGLHSSILQGCMCQYSMQAMKEGKDFTMSKPWVGLTQEDINIAFDDTQEGGGFDDFARAIEATLKRKNT